MCNVDWKMLLEYLRVLLNWPPVIGVLGAWTMYLFRHEIRAKLKTLHQVKLAGQEATFAEQTQPETPVAEVKLPGDDAPQEVVPQLAINYEYSQEALLIAGTAEAMQRGMHWAHTNPGPTVDEFMRMSEKLFYEKIFVLIFGSQVAALAHAAKWGTPQNISTLQAFADLHKERSQPPVHSTLEEFTGYLFSQELLMHVDPPGANLTCVTVRGQRFLAYIQAEYPHLWNNKPW